MIRSTGGRALQFLDSKQKQYLDQLFIVADGDAGLVQSAIIECANRSPDKTPRLGDVMQFIAAALQGRHGNDSALHP